MRDERANPDAAAGLASVLVPCCGQLEYTRLLLPGLLRQSRWPMELLFLDAGSLDGTAEFLAGVQAAASLRVEVVRAAADPEVPAATRELLARVRGEFLVLLNNDTVVSDAWLDQLVALAQLDPQIGLVGPMSNAAAPPQLVEEVPYRLRPAGGDGPPDVGPVDRFAREWREWHRGQWAEVEHLGGFCLLVKRRVVADLGLFQAGAGLGVFDTDALCRGARLAGYTLACCRDLFVHHFGSRTFSHGAPAS
jgi:GT2 family glycosyltransferase